MAKRQSTQKYEHHKQKWGELTNKPYFGRIAIEDDSA
jgi:hypothetical protein